MIVRFKMLFALSLVSVVGMVACSSAPAPQPMATALPSQTAQPATPLSTATSVPTAAATIAPTTAPTESVVGTSTPVGTPGKVLFQDDYATPSKSWFTGKADNGSVYEFTNGGYRIYVGAEDASQLSWLSGKTSDVSIEVDAKQVGGPEDGRFGITCRGDGDKAESGYLFVISPSNLYGIHKMIKGTPYALAEYSLQASSILSGSAVNHLRADCVKNTLTLYVNGQKLLDVQDADYATGSIGLVTLTGFSAKKGVDALFDNFVAREASAANVAPTAIPTVPVFSKVLFQDKFTDPTTGWPRRSDQDVIADYNAAGYYQVKVNNTEKRFIVTPKKNLNDVSIQVDLSKRAGPELSGFGPACRVQDDNNYYVFLIGSDGYYGIRKIKAGEAIDLSAHEKMASSLKQGDKANNRVRADCIGDRLTLYVNDQKLDEVRDSEFKSGDVGLSFRSVNQPGLEIFFANFEVRGP